MPVRVRALVRDLKGQWNFQNLNAKPTLISQQTVKQKQFVDAFLPCEPSDSSLKRHQLRSRLEFAEFIGAWYFFRNSWPYRTKLTVRGGGCRDIEYSFMAESHMFGEHRQHRPPARLSATRRSRPLSAAVTHGRALRDLPAGRREKLQPLRLRSPDLLPARSPGLPRGRAERGQASLTLLSYGPRRRDSNSRYPEFPAPAPRR